ncbi:dynamin family protein [Jannaschia pohangensis]|uniref:Dynamin family protein n=1 Tax=Jannaschia pohangensis TaxID=390807 RepID=A0A1I3GQE0_9RHOB|nr:dynamin family protein [Jannaschia pohangensis]SFI25660.1 Dynamin family protein [Jannaschia pohangensis]
MSELPVETRSILEAWFSQKPVFALMGEYSAGKSTLLNLLLGNDFLPTQVTATNMPVVWLTYGETRTGQALTRDGQLTEFDIDKFREAGEKNVLLLRISLPAEILKTTDIVDTPGISDPRLAAGALSFLSRYLDFAIWCSAANQAWRQSEKAMWTAMPAQLQANSLMALTRSDLLKSSDGLRKVLKRCRSEAGEFFRDVVPIATVSALAARSADGKTFDLDRWVASHADLFLAELNASISTAITACDIRELREVPKPTIVTPAKTETKTAPKSANPAAEKAPEKTTRKKPGGRSTTRATAKPKRAKTKSTVAKSETSVSTRVSSMIASLRELRTDEGQKSSNEHLNDTLNHLFTTFFSDLEVSEDHRAVFARSMLLGRPGDAPVNAVIVQLERELEDFTESAWFALDQNH